MKKTTKFVTTSVVSMDRKGSLTAHIIMVYCSSTRHSRLRTYIRCYLRVGNSVLSIPLQSRKQTVITLRRILIALLICHTFTKRRFPSVRPYVKGSAYRLFVFVIDRNTHVVRYLFSYVCYCRLFKRTF